MSERLEIPTELGEAIRAGRCVAFIGAGFVIPAVPPWQALLEQLAESIDDGHAEKLEIIQWLKHAKVSRDNEGIAECIQAVLGDQFMPQLRARLTAGSLPPDIRRRLDFLHEVPFRAVLTTNFDTLIDGDLPGPDVYARILTVRDRAWWDRYYWDDGQSARTPCVKLHGKLENPESLVFTTREYRRRLHENPNYRAFLRALFATHTVLFLGFSFTDAYVNDLRSEVLAMLGTQVSNSRGHDFAVMNDVPGIARRHFADNEGLEILSYSTNGSDHSGFDRWLDAIQGAAGPERVLKDLVAGKKILWVDPSRKNNDKGFAVLHPSVTPVDTPEAALVELRKLNAGPSSADSAGRYDLIITRFGWQGDRPSLCEQLLLGMRDEDLRAPVIVFASGDRRAENRARALELGALAFTDRWEELFQTLEAHLVDAGSCL